jgi:RND superfamily putative drug exporter
MEVGVPEASVLPDRYESRAGDDILKEDFDYASLTPIEVLATLPDDPASARGLDAMRDLGESVEETEGVERVESLYTIGTEAAREYAESLNGAREEAGPLATQLPELPEGVSADGDVTPEGVANVLALPEVRDSEEVENALKNYTAGDRALLRTVTESSPSLRKRATRWGRCGPSSRPTA